MSQTPIKSKHRWLKVALGLCVLVVLGILLLPTILSGVGKSFVVSQINGQVVGQLQIQNLEVGWFSGQKITGVTLLDAQGKEILSVKKINLPDTTLASLAMGNLDFGRVEIDLDSLTLEQYPDGTTNLQNALSPPGSSPAPGSAPGSTPGNSPPDSPTPTPKQEPAGRTSGGTAFSDFSDLLPKGLNASVTVNVGQIQWVTPSLPPASLSDCKVVVQATAGKPITGEISTGLAYSGVGGQFQASLSLAQKLALSKTSLTLDVTPEAWKSLVPQSQATLLKPFALEIAVEKLSVPMADGQINLAQLVMDATVRLTDLMLRTPDRRLGDLMLRDAVMTAKRASATSLGEFAFSAKAIQGHRTGSVNFKATLEGLMQQLGVSDPDWSAVKAQVHGKVTDVGMALVDELAQTDGLIREAIGETLSAEVQGQMRWVANQPAGQLSMTAKAQRLDLSLALALDESGLSQRETGRLDLQVTPKLAARWLGEASLKKPVGLSLAIADMRLPRTQGVWQFEKAGFHLTATSDDIDLKTQALKAGDPSVRKLTLNLQSNALATGAKVSMAADIFVGTAKGGKLTMTAKMVDLLTKPVAPSAKLAGQEKTGGASGATSGVAGEPGEPGVADVHLAVTRVPTSLIGSLAGQGRLLEALLGAEITRVSLTSSGRLDQQSTFSLDLQTPLMGLRAKGQLTPDGIALVDGTTAKMKITPVSLAALLAATQSQAVKPMTWSLTSPTMLTLVLGKTFIPFNQEKQLETRISSRLTATDISLIRSVDKQPLTIRGLQLGIEAARLTEPITLDVAATLINNKKTATLKSKTTIKNLVDAKGQINPLKATMHTQTSAPALPIDLIDQLLDQEGKLADILGHQADVTIAGDYPGNLDLTVKSPTAQLEIPAHIDQKRVLTLRKNAVALLEVNEQTAKGLLKWGNPLLLDATASRKPIRAVIHAKNFSVPLEDFDLQKVTADIDLELGTIILQDSWLLGALGPKLQSLDRQMNLSKRQEAKFTKFSVSLKHGIATTNDLWMLTKDSLVGTQGLVNLQTERANLTLGIAAETLYQIDGRLRKYIKPDAVLEIPVRGPINNLQPDFSRLFIDVAKALAQGALAERAGKYGSLIQLGLGVIDQGSKSKGLSQRQATHPWPNRPKPPVPPVPPKPQVPPKNPSASQTQKTPANNAIQEPAKKAPKPPTVNDLLNQFLR